MGVGSRLISAVKGNIPNIARLRIAVSLACTYRWAFASSLITGMVVDCLGTASQTGRAVFFLYSLLPDTQPQMDIRST